MFDTGDLTLIQSETIPIKKTYTYDDIVHINTEPGVEYGSPALQADSLQSEPQGKLIPFPKHLIF